MSLSRRDAPQIIQAVFNEAEQALQVTGDISVSNPAVGPNGQPIPTSADLVAGENPSGNLEPLQTDASGNLLVNVAAGAITAENPSVSTTGAAVPAYGTAIAGKNGSGNLTDVSVDASGNVNTNVISSALPSGAATSANQTTANSSLSTIATNTTGVSTAANQTTGNTSLATIATNSGTQATAANQTSVIGSSSAGTAATNSELVGGVYRSAGETLTNGQQSALGLDSTGALLVSAKQTSTPWTVADTANISAAGGTSASVATQVAGKYTSVLPTLTSGQAAALAVDSSTRLITAPLTSASVVTAELQDGSGNALSSTSGSLNVNVTNEGTLATSANQTSEITQLTAINSNTSHLPASLGQTTSSNSFPVVLPSNYSPAMTADVQSSGTISAISGNVSILFNGVSVVTMNGMNSSFSGQLQPQLLCADGVTWINCIVYLAPTGASITILINSNVGGTYEVPVQGFRGFRLIATTYSSGSVVMNLNASAATSIAKVVSDTASDFNTTSQISDGTNVANVAAASTAPTTTQKALVVTQSPNSPGATAANQASEITQLTQIATNTTGAITSSGNLTAVNQAVTLSNIDLYSTLVANISGTWVGTITFEGSYDGVNFVGIAAYTYPSGIGNIATATTNGTFGVNSAGLMSYRLRCSAYTSGTIAVTATATQAITSVYVKNSTASALMASATLLAGTQTIGGVKLVDTAGTNVATIKAASTPSVTTDTAIVVAISPNNSISSTVKGTTIGNVPVQNIYSTTNITTSAYVQLVASTTNVINTVHIFDSSGQAMIFSVGASGSEVDQLYIPPGGDTYAIAIPAGSRIAYKALSASATSGYLLMSFLS